MFCRKYILWNVFIGILCVNSLRPSDAYMRRKTNNHWFRQWLVAWTAPSHYLNQCWNIVDWTRRNKLQWNLNKNSNIFIHENALQNIVWKMAAILSRPQCINILGHDDAYMDHWTASLLAEVMICFPNQWKLIVIVTLQEHISVKVESRYF